MKSKILITILIFSTILITKAEASDTSDKCVTECVEGKHKIGFSDGDQAHCSCVNSGSDMAETVVNENSQEPTLEDGEPLDDNNTDTVPGA